MSPKTGWKRGRSVTHSGVELFSPAMRHSQSPKHRQRLLPEGRRWGFGAHSVVPYLTHTRPEDTAQAGQDIRNPVFPQMEQALRTLRDRH